MPRGVYIRKGKKKPPESKKFEEVQIAEVIPVEEFPIVEEIPVIYPGDLPPDDYKNLGHWGNVPELVVEGKDWTWKCPNWKCGRPENRCLITKFVDFFHTHKRMLKAVTCQGCGRRYVFPGQIFDRLLGELLEENDEV